MPSFVVLHLRLRARPPRLMLCQRPKAIFQSPAFVKSETDVVELREGLATVACCSNGLPRKAKALTDAFAKASVKLAVRQGLADGPAFCQRVVAFCALRVWEVHTSAAMQLDITLTGQLASTSHTVRRCPSFKPLFRSLADCRAPEQRATAQAHHPVVDSSGIFCPCCLSLGSRPCVQLCWRHVWIAHVGDCRCVLAARSSESMQLCSRNSRERERESLRNILE